MHPILFEAGQFTIYTYGFCIAMGAVLGGLYMWQQGKKQFGWSFDQANTLFVLLMVGGVVGGKIFVVFENPSFYLKNLDKLFSGSGFVFYGSLLTSIPIMLWYFKKNRIPTLAMLDVMALLPASCMALAELAALWRAAAMAKLPIHFWVLCSLTPSARLNRKNVSLHPTQLYEAALIFSILIFLLIYKPYKKFDGQLFIGYLIIYALGRGVLEIFRGDLERGFVVKDFLSTSQFISLLVISVAIYFYVKLNRKPNLGVRS